GRLAHTESADGTTQDFFYDALGRLEVQAWTVDGEAFELKQTYDPFGRQKTLAYPEAPGRSRFTVERRYTPSNDLEDVHDGDSSTGAHWHVDKRNSDDALVQATLGKSLVASRGYDDTTGRLTSVAEGSALALTYEYDWDGLVEHRTDSIANRIDTFSYDALHR